MLKTSIVSIYELPEPSRTFVLQNGAIGLIFEPSKFYILAARYNLAKAFDIVEGPIIHDVGQGEYLMYFCESHYVEGTFYIFISVGCGGAAVDLSNCVEMNLEQEFEVNYDTAEQINYGRTP